MRASAFKLSKYFGAVAVAAAVAAKQNQPMRIALALGALTLIVGGWEWWRDASGIKRARRLIRSELHRFLVDGPQNARLVAWLSARDQSAPLGEDAEKFMRVPKRRNRFPGLIKIAEDADLLTDHLRDCDDAVDELGRFADAWNTGGLAKLPSGIALQEYRQRTMDLSTAASNAMNEIGES